MNVSSRGALGAVLLSTLALGAGHRAGKTGDPDAGEAASCVSWRAEVRYRGYGYDHVVVMNNHCGGAAYCEVSSESTPSPASVTVLPGEEREVLLRRGSPARAFTPLVVCQVDLRPR